MKKSLSVLLALVLLIGVLGFGCSKGDNDTAADVTDTTATTDVQVNSATSMESSDEAETTAPAEQTEDITTEYADTDNGFTTAQLESVMYECMRSNDWSKLNDYILPYGKEIVDTMAATEAEEAKYEKYDYTYCSWYGSGSINNYRDSFLDLPSAESFSCEYLNLDEEDKKYSEAMYKALYESMKYDYDDEYIKNATRTLSDMAKAVFNEKCGSEMEFIDLKVMKACAVDDETELNMFIYVFVIETDCGYFFLCQV